ncbi:MAG: PKD domain-containing protein [Desulfobacteraceae bacterium]
MLCVIRNLITYWVIAVIVYSGQSLATDIAPAPSKTNLFSGQLEILVADSFETNISQRRYAIRIRQPDDSYRVYAISFASQPPDSSLQSGDWVTIQGRFLENAIVADSIQRVSQIQGKESLNMAEMVRDAPLTIGDRRAIVLVVDMNDAVNPYDTDDLVSMMYTGTQNVTGLYEASSFQQLSFDPNSDGVGGPDVFGPFTIDHSISEDCTLDNPYYYNVIMNWAAAADEAAENQGIDLSLYQHRIYFLPNQVGCDWQGMATLGCTDYNCRAWVIKSNSSSDEGRYIAHELGHNIDWNHSSTDSNNDGELDSEYGDSSGIMGYPDWAQANAPHRDQLEWFDAYPGALVSADCSDTFDLYALELDPGVDTVGTQVIKIDKPDSNEYYYISYRRQITTYPSRAQYADRINIHRYGDDGGRTFHITNLQQGDTFQDSANGITVRATAAGGAIATVTVEIPNQEPAAAFSPTNNHLEVVFNNTSSDSDGSIASYQWNFGDGTSSSQANPSHTYATGGTFSVSLTVTDNCGDTDTVTRDVSIVPNNPPVADFSATANHLTVQFSDTSSDSDGNIQSRQWRFGDGASSDQTHPSHTYSASGTYPVSLLITDDDGSQDTLTKQITVVANVAPTARFSFTTDILHVQFSDESTDSDGNVASHQWDFGDGQTSVEAAPGHTYASGGSYTVTLTVTDDDGATHTDTQSVVVEAPVIAAAIPEFGFSVSGLTVTFTDNTTGSVASYHWDFGDGATSVEVSPSHTYAQAGTYTVALRVTNATGSNTATQQVTVQSDDTIDPDADETITPDANNSGGSGGGGGGCFISNFQK